ncbi:TolA-binding protein [Sphingomonas kaistensis]|uniref:TolA-binding protein n=1 Tax=Sphingomonas kaistensis TaxID=298708 RepID=A0A7X6BG90_9SPHN|nr:tetratricopeptide repeat protein [Sphingomonas kaistensis]NJC05210.1 TolA-binding protein [Sphingomonas kaistensis]
MKHTLILGLAALTLTVPAAAQKQQPSPEDRIYRLERQTRQLQRQVFPKGQPADTAGFDDSPAASQVVVVALSNRIDALERQLAESTRLAEENGNRVATLETEIARMRTDLDARLRAIENGGAAPQPAAAGASETAEAATTPAAPVRTVEAAPLPRPVRTGDATADGEAAYDAGYQLWLQKRYPQAVTALKSMATTFPGHRRVSWANNLAGRALLDSGQPRAAAEALLANYRGNPKGERAADSLFYLGEALVALKQPAQACKAYAELEEVYGGSMRADLQRLLPPAKTRARC